MSNEHHTVLVDRYQKAATTPANANSYKGHAIHALPGLHDFLADKVVGHCEQGSAVLDLAAGSGAMSLRLQDLGFKVTATDYVSENFKLESVPFIQADLNGNFASAYPHQFDAVVASEIIEHLENPRHFAREIFKLLKPGGRLIVSTPNVENAGAKASFIRSGHFLWFDEHDYEGQGHITPLTQWQMTRSFSEAGLRFLWQGSFGDGASRLGGSPRLRIIAHLIKLLASIDQALSREIYVAVLERPSV